MLADNNMLAHALDWTTQPASGPQLSLHMSRDKAIVASRVDMDQAMETADVHPATGPGIYDKLLPILAQWKQAYNFVGSYYIDIGNNPPRARRPTGPIPRSTTTRCWRWATRSAPTPIPIPRTPISLPRRNSSSSSSSRAR